MSKDERIGLFLFIVCAVVIVATLCTAAVLNSMRIRDCQRAGYAECIGWNEVNWCIKMGETAPVMESLESVRERLK